MLSGVTNVSKVMCISLIVVLGWSLGLIPGDGARDQTMDLLIVSWQNYVTGQLPKQGNGMLYCCFAWITNVVKYLYQFTVL